MSRSHIYIKLQDNPQYVIALWIKTIELVMRKEYGQLCKSDLELRLVAATNNKKII